MARSLDTQVAPTDANGFILRLFRRRRNVRAAPPAGTTPPGLFYSPAAERSGGTARPSEAVGLRDVEIGFRPARSCQSRNLKRFLASRKKRPISAVVTRKLIRISAHCSTHRIVVRFAEFGLGPRDRIKRPGNRRKNSNDF